MVEALFIVETILAWVLLTVTQIPLRKEEHKAIRTMLFVVKVLLIPIMALLFVAIEWVVSYSFGSVLCAIYVALIGDVVASIVEYAVRRIKFRDDNKSEQRHRYDHRIGIPIGLAVCLVVLAFGTVNAETVQMDTHEWKADGLDTDHTFAFASDLHTGSAQSMDTLRNFCEQVNDSNAEFLILGGDITDELTSYEEMVETYHILSSVSIPTYFVCGNHDRQPDAHFVGGRTYTDAQLEDAITSAGITILSDEYLLVSPDLVLLGREDFNSDTRKPWSDLTNPYPETTLIVADHQPYDEEQLKIEVSALQVSGHTHAGQLWPLQTLYNLLDLPSYGEFHYPGTRLYVSPGTGGWALPLRTEAHCAWELITLHP